MPYDDCQSFFNVFTQISPAEETFGWKILVANQPMPIVVDNMIRRSTMTRTFRGCSGEFVCKLESHPEVPTRVWCLLCDIRGFKLWTRISVCSDSPGPSTMPVRSSIFSSLVTTRMPSGGLFFNSVISRIKRRMVAGVRDCQPIELRLRPARRVTKNTPYVAE
jgi:hypothetical protein